MHAANACQKKSATEYKHQRHKLTQGQSEGSWCLKVENYQKNELQTQVVIEQST